MAEYREIRHVGAALNRSLNRKTKFDISEIPTKFTLNSGHVKFFYDKGIYLSKRFRQIREELHRRGFNLDPSIKFDNGLFPDGFRNDWIPTADAEQLIRNRIAERISQRPGFYRYYREKID